jgi:uncharacterized protein GlcG (DUF336 family)
MCRLGLKWSMLVAGTVSVGRSADGKLPRMRWVRAALPALPGLIPFAAGVPLLNDGHMIGAAGANGAAPAQDDAVASDGTRVPFDAGFNHV